MPSTGLLIDLWGKKTLGLRRWQQKLTKVKSKEEEEEKKPIRISKNCGTTNYKKCSIHVMRISKGKEIKEQSNIWSNNDQKFSQINVRHQIIEIK